MNKTGLYNKKTEIPVMEHFYTLQGEGFHQGKAAYFIRLAGCDVGCHWCDVKDSWEVKNDQIMAIQTLISTMDAFPKGICVITGGEPAMYNLDNLTNIIKNAGWQTHIETSGAYEIKGNFDWICVSPKKFKEPILQALEMAHELKAIIFNNSDFDWAEKNAIMVANNCSLFLQPEWSKEKLVLPLIVEYIMKDPKWRISMQTHKYLGIE